MSRALFRPKGLRALLFLMSFGVAAAGTAAAKQPVPYVVELFTSQGCSSCPAADQLLAKIAHDPEAIALSLPVDYWDYMGWKDTLASPEFTARQKDYAAARGDGHVYTPQAVVDGLVHVVGSNENELKSAARAAYGASGALSVPLALKRSDGKLVADVGGANPAAKSGSLWLVRIATQRKVAVGRGENAGHTLTYTNVVRSMSSFGQWNGTPAQFEVPPPALDSDADAFVVLLQAGTPLRPGAILAAAKGEGL